MFGLETILTTVLGSLIGGSGSALSKWMGMREKKINNEHELKLIEMQINAKRSETENNLSIAQEKGYADIRTKSYEHDGLIGETSIWVNNALRMVRPVLTLLLIALIWAIWITIAKEDIDIKNEIIDGVLFMSSVALAWWFGDRSPMSKKMNSIK